MSALRRAVRLPFLLVIRFYQAVISPWLPSTCKYYPSCSAYAYTAIERHGPLRGIGLAVWRLLRCNPWSKGGVDHVPPARGRDKGVPRVTHPAATGPGHTHRLDSVPPTPLPGA